MADLSSIGDLIAGFAPEGPLRRVVLVIYGLCAAIAPFVYKYYFGVLAQGAKSEGSIERQDYDRLRASLIEGNLAARLYAKWLANLLDWIDKFFGDAGMADRTLFPHAFGLKVPAPLWTAPAFDRCLLLALVYPIATIFLIWAISGHVGPAEVAVGLRPDVPGWARWLGLVMSFGFASYAIRRSVRLPRWKSHVFISMVWALAVAATFVVFSAAMLFGVDLGAALDYANGFAVGLPFSFAIVGACSIAGAGAVAYVFAFSAVFLVAFSYTAPYLNASPGVPSNGSPNAFEISGIDFHVTVLVLAFSIVFAITAAFFFFSFLLSGGVATAIADVVTAVNHKATVIRRQGVFLCLFLTAMILLCLVLADLLSPGTGWKVNGRFVLFLGLFTLLNAPFDWASLGLTRALLRRGLELGGWWPYVLAFVDACLAGIIIAILAFIMVIGVQAFDELAVHGGGAKAAVLPLVPLFDGIAKNPAAPEYWWAYALLLSTMIPSLVNLAIGGMALTRGVPGVSRLLLRWIPEGRDVPDYRRPLAALVLTGQMFAGAFLGIAAQAFLAWELLYYLMPAIGLDLLWLCQQLADLDLPGKFFHLTGIIP
jgi:hypothetical protein